jgi:hypothetical protein
MSRQRRLTVDGGFIPRCMVENCEPRRVATLDAVAALNGEAWNQPSLRDGNRIRHDVPALKGRPTVKRR